MVSHDQVVFLVMFAVINFLGFAAIAKPAMLHASRSKVIFLKRKKCFHKKCFVSVKVYFERRKLQLFAVTKFL